MNCLLLSNNGIALNLPPSLGGSVANYNYMLKLDMIYKQAWYCHQILIIKKWLC